jgi:Flp pilus assembly protein TadG
LIVEIARRRPNERGSATVEFALVVLPLFAVLFLAMDVAWMIFGWACLQEAAREGVRYAVTCSGQSETTLDSATRQVVQQYAFGFVTASEISVDYYPATGYSSAGVPATIDGTNGSTSAGNLVKVTISGVRLNSFAPLFRSVSTYQLSASATDILQ